MKKIQILLIEDNRLLRDGIAAMLKRQPDMHVATAAGKEEEIFNIVDLHKPNIVLLELGLLNQNSLKIVKLIRETSPDAKIIIMDLIPIQKNVLEFVQAGVSGFILKDANAAELYKTIRKVFQGAQILPHQLTGSLFSQIVEHAEDVSTNSIIDKSVRLTKREKQVVELISEGLTNKEIALKLRLSHYTVKSHVHNILEKLALTTRVQIAKYSFIAETKETAKNSVSLIS